MPRRRNQFDPGNAFPGFADVTEIGSGAFASVYRAIEIDTRRSVALKMLRPASLRPHVLETFTREMRALAAVSGHPHIVTLFRPFTSPDGHPVLVIELCRESMAQRLRRVGPLPAQEVVSVGIKIAGALETAHRAGFLHRDMKPQNILVTEFGEPALADFGVAALQASAQDTEGVFGFTTLHAPPEILQGHRLSAATDVYGLASTMYQLLAGRAPFPTFEGEAPASVILRILRDPVEPLQSHGIPYVLSTTLESALAKDPAERPQTAIELADRLRAVEASCGWPPTSYVVWGSAPDRRATPLAPPSAARLAAMSAAPEPVPVPPVSPGALPPAARPASPGAVPPLPLLSPSAPVPPATPIGPTPAAAPPAAATPSATPIAPTPSAAATPPGTPAGPVTTVTPQPPPPPERPPLVASGPSVVVPAQVGRHVIDPGADPAYRPAAGVSPAGDPPSGPEAREAPEVPSAAARPGVTRPPVPPDVTHPPSRSGAPSLPPWPPAPSPTFPPPPGPMVFPTESQATIPRNSANYRLRNEPGAESPTPESIAPRPTGQPQRSGRGVLGLLLAAFGTMIAGAIIVLVVYGFLTGRL